MRFRIDVDRPRASWLAVLGAMLFIAGCNSATHGYLIKQQTAPGDWPKFASLQIEIDTQGFLSVSAVQDPQARAEMSQSLSTAYQSVPPTPGAGAGDMAAAYVITAYLFKARADSEMYAEANARALALSSTLAEEARQKRIKSLLRDSLLALQSVTIMTDQEFSDCCPTNITTRPQVQLSNDLQTLEVKLDVVVTDVANGNTRYRNSFVYLSDPAPGANAISYWSGDDAAHFYRVLACAFAEIARMVDFDFTAHNDPGKPKMSTIGFRNATGTFFERGTLLWNAGERIVLRDLRGNLRSFPGQLM